ncbi:MAG: OmpA family protein, partial [Deltaproteobacteria bacterium]|nr:OmpA family protein [Deltaproteobacteria bacterium]
SGYITIEGHTDDTKPKKTYSNNWELSMARALTVMDYLERAHHLNEKKLVPIARASSHPLTPNKDEGSRAKNRRVEFILSYDHPL